MPLVQFHVSCSSFQSNVNLKKKWYHMHTRLGARTQNVPRVNPALTSTFHNDRSPCCYRLYCCISHVPFLCMEANRKNVCLHTKMWSNMIDKMCCHHHSFLSVVLVFLLCITWSAAWACRSRDCNNRDFVHHKVQRNSSWICKECKGLFSG